MAVELRWDDRGLLRTVDRVSEQNMKRGAAFLRSKIRRTLNRQNPGDQPSRPGEAPRKISGALRNAIVFAVERDGRDIVAGVGLAKGRGLHGRDLELGNPAMNLEPRPYLRPALLASQRQLAKILAGEKLGRGRR